MSEKRSIQSIAAQCDRNEGRRLGRGSRDAADIPARELDSADTPSGGNSPPHLSPPLDDEHDWPPPENVDDWDSGHWGELLSSTEPELDTDFTSSIYELDEIGRAEDEAEWQDYLYWKAEKRCQQELEDNVRRERTRKQRRIAYRLHREQMEQLYKPKRIDPALIAMVAIILLGILILLSTG